MTASAKPDPNKSGMAGYHSFKFMDTGEEYGSFEVFWDDADIPEHGDTPRNYDAAGNPVAPGWYWAAGFPGCLWDSEPVGPFATSKAAWQDARFNV